MISPLPAPEILKQIWHTPALTLPCMLKFDPPATELTGKAAMHFGNSYVRHYLLRRPPLFDWHWLHCESLDDPNSRMSVCSVSILCLNHDLFSVFSAQNDWEDNLGWAISKFFVLLGLFFNIHWAIKHECKTWIGQHPVTRQASCGCTSQVWFVMPHVERPSKKQACMDCIVERRFFFPYVATVFGTNDNVYVW